MGPVEGVGPVVAFEGRSRNVSGRLFELAVNHVNRTMTTRGKCFIVGNQDQSCPVLFLQVKKQVHDHLAGFTIEVPCWFVGQLE
jgi:hypothetical protein